MRACVHVILKIIIMCIHAHECVLCCTSIVESAAHCCPSSGVKRIACEVQVEWGRGEAHIVDNDFKAAAVHGYV